MSDITGTVHHSFGGCEYCLRLTLGGIAKLQMKHGNDLGGMLTGRAADASEIPKFGLMIDIVTVALEKGGIAPELDAAALADDMLTADKGLATRLLQAAFPEADKQASSPGKKKAPKAKA